jgi:hypothetical protein
MLSNLVLKDPKKIDKQSTGFIMIIILNKEWKK